MSNREALQASLRAATGTAHSFNEDWLALFDAEDIPPGHFDERQLVWINTRLGTNHETLADARNAFAVLQGKASWGELVEIDKVRVSLNMASQRFWIYDGSGHVSYPFASIPSSTFGRDLAASGWTKSGTGVELTEFTVDTPRFVVDPGAGLNRGYLSEPAATNLCFQSDALKTSPWVTAGAVSTTINALMAPDGTVTATRLSSTNQTGGGGDRGFLQPISTIGAGAQLIVSAYFYRKAYRYVKFNGFGNGSGGVAFDLENAVAQVNGTWDTAGIAEKTEDWLRAWATLTTSTNGTVYVGLTNGLSGGNGSDAPINEDMFVWRVDVKAGNVLSSAVKTTTAAGTRPQDSWEISGLSSQFPINRPVVARVKCVLPPVPALPRAYLFRLKASTTVDDRFDLFVTSTGNMVAQVYSNGSLVGNAGNAAYTPGEEVELEATFSADLVELKKNGVQFGNRDTVVGALNTRALDVLHVAGENNQALGSTIEYIRIFDTSSP